MRHSWFASLTSCLVLLAACHADTDADLGSPDAAVAPDAAEDDVGSADAADAAPLVLRDVAYSPRGAFDLYRPAGAQGPVPLVVWVHGGAWLTGDKANNMADKVALFTGAGYALASINYRLSPDPPSLADPDRVMFPMHPHDVGDAIDYLRDHAAALELDPSRIAVLGHSAGAHLVALVSTDPRYLADGPRSIRCTGSFDTEGYDIPATLETATDQQRLIYESAFGTDQAVQRAASPITHVAANRRIPPFLIATRGTSQRKAQQQAFRDALIAAGVSAQMIDATGLSHEEVNDHIGQAGDTIMTPAITSFLASCLQ